MAQLNDIFDKTGDADWLAQIERDLKGKKAEDIAKSKILEGIDLKVFYSAQDRKLIEIDRPAGWKIGMPFGNPEEANSFLKKGAAGVDAISLYPGIGLDELKSLSLDIHLNFSGSNESESGDSYDQLVSACFDPIEHLLHKGDWLKNEGDDLSDFNRHVAKWSDLGIASLVVNANIAGEAGANATHELAIAAAHLNEYLSRVETQVDKIEIRIAIGTDYFLELSKFRALRIILQNVLKAHNLDAEIELVAMPNPMYFSSVDVNTNILRSTTMCMSAILGGADRIEIPPHDILDKNSLFGMRIARNIQLLMEKEAHLDKISDPAAGSYYIDALTHTLAENAWQSFQELEGKGGLIECFKRGEIQQSIQKTVEQRKQMVTSDAEILIGINKFELDGKPKVKSVDTSNTTYPPLSPIYLEDLI